MLRRKCELRSSRRRLLCSSALEKVVDEDDEEVEEEEEDEDEDGSEDEDETEGDPKALMETGKAELVLRLQLSVISCPGYGLLEVAVSDA